MSFKIESELRKKARCLVARNFGSSIILFGAVRGFMVLCAMLMPTLIQPVAAAPFAYITNSTDGDGTVSVIDTATNPPSVVAIVQVAPHCSPRVCGSVLAIAVAPDGKRVYVTVVEGLNRLVGSIVAIDTATNMVAAKVPVDGTPRGIAVAPDGKHVYVMSQLQPGFGIVSVIDTATNFPFVVTTIQVGNNPQGAAVTPDGKHVYVANSNSGTVSVIATATNTVVATIQVENSTVASGVQAAVAITPNGKHVYVTNNNSGTISVIDTATNTVAATVVGGGSFPQGVAVAPDGKHAYVTSITADRSAIGIVSVIDTASNTVMATVNVGFSPFGVAITPDGKHAYVANSTVPGTVLVIDTATNTVVATVQVGNGPFGVSIVPPPVGVPFLTFNAALEFDLDRVPKKDHFELQSSFTLSNTTPQIDPVTKPLALQVGTFSIIVPSGSFRKHEDWVFTFHGIIDGMKLKAIIKRTGTLRYAFHATVWNANLAGTKNPVYVTLTIGDDSGATSVKADIDH